MRGLIRMIWALATVIHNRSSGLDSRIDSTLFQIESFSKLQVSSNNCSNCYQETNCWQYSRSFENWLLNLKWIFAWYCQHEWYYRFGSGSICNLIWDRRREGFCSYLSRLRSWLDNSWLRSCNNDQVNFRWKGITKSYVLRCNELWQIFIENNCDAIFLNCIHFWAYRCNIQCQISACYMDLVETIWANSSMNFLLFCRDST